MVRVFLVLLLLYGCGESVGTDGGGVDAARIDSGRRDAAMADAGDAGGVDIDAAGLDAGPPDPPGPWTVYVSVGGESRVAVVDLSEAGVATERTAASLSLSNGPGAMARDRTTGRFYVGTGGGTPAIVTIAIDGAGVPSEVGRTEGLPNPVYLAAASGGRLVSAYFGANELRLHDVSGAPMHPQEHQVSTDEEPHAITIGPNGLFYVPHRNGGTTWWVRLNADDTLEMLGELASDSGVGPRHIAFHPTADFAYIINEFDDSVSTHSIASDGALTRLETVSALPGGVDGSSNTGADIHVTEDGRYLYSSNRGHDSIARFAIGSDGLLTFLGTTPTEETPREFELTEGGGYLLSLGQGNGFMAVYAIGDDGDLTMSSRLDLGSDLRWAIAVLN